jgi:hypothetical protein
MKSIKISGCGTARAVQDERQMGAFRCNLEGRVDVRGRSDRIYQFREIEDIIDPEKYIGTAVEQVEAVVGRLRGE